MRKQYHFKQIKKDVFIWDVHNLIKLSENLPIIEVDLTDIKDFDMNFWYQYSDSIPTCKSICNHFKLIEQADLTYPIILNCDGSVMDGMHRICKAYLRNHKKIKAKQFDQMPAPDFKNKHPNELEY